MSQPSSALTLPFARQPAVITIVAPQTSTSRSIARHCTRSAPPGATSAQAPTIASWLKIALPKVTPSVIDGSASLALRGRAKPDALLAAVVLLPNELAWHVLSFWPAEAD